MTKLKWIHFLVLLAIIGGCGVFIGNPDDADTASYESVPDDSSGTDGSLSLTVSSEDGLTVQGQIPLPNGLTIEVGKIVVTRIKMLPLSEETDRERAIDSQFEEIEGGESEENSSARDEILSSLAELKSEYDGLIAAASEDDKEDLRESEDEQRQELESELAAIEKEIEDEKDEYEEARDETLKFTEVYVYDLIARNILPEPPTITLADGGYARLEFQTRPFRGADDIKFQNRSILVTGNYALNDENYHFEFEVREPLEYILRGSEDFQVSAEEDNSLVIKFVIQEWFRGVALEEATVNDRGEIHINAGSNLELYALINKNIRRSTTFGKDEDGDGQLAEDESTGDGSDFVD